MSIKSALFIDFDNVYVSLLHSSKSAARKFARFPNEWVEWFEAGNHDSTFEYEPRRTLIKRCYLNPEKFGEYRKFFTFAGFQTVDCPSLTGIGKNSADIHMVLDVIDAMDHPAEFDEFLILSADADFTPILLRLREHDKITTVMSTAVTSSALKNAATNTFDLDEFIDQALSEKVEGVTDAMDGAVRFDTKEAELAYLADVFQRKIASDKELPLSAIGGLLRQVYAPFRESTDWLGFKSLYGLVNAVLETSDALAKVEEPEGAFLRSTQPIEEASTHVTTDAVLDYIEGRLSAVDDPIRGSVLGNSIIRRFGQEVKSNNWFGTGSLTKMVQVANRERLAVSPSQGGLIYDPTRHSIGDSTAVAPAERLEGLDEDLRNFLLRVDAINWPQLHPIQLQAVIAGIAAEIQAGETERNPMSASVRDLIQKGIEDGNLPETARVARSSINFLLTGMNLNGAEFGENCTTVDDVRRFLKLSLTGLISSRLGETTDHDKVQIERLIYDTALAHKVAAQ